MPVMDGFSATKKIRAFGDKSLAKIPIIAMTAKTSDEDKKTALESGMNAHVSKPLETKTLFSVIKSVL